MDDRQYYIDIVTNTRHTALYTGVTSDLKRRVWEHKGKFVDGFTKRYNICYLVYYEVAEDALSAIGREKQIKGGSRQDKIDLISCMNPQWRDLYEELWIAAACPVLDTGSRLPSGLLAKTKPSIGD